MYVLIKHVIFNDYLYACRLSLLKQKINLYIYFLSVILYIYTDQMNIVNFRNVHILYYYYNLMFKIYVIGDSLLKQFW